MDDERLYRGEIKCTKCHTEKSKWRKNGSGLIPNENGTYSAYCNDHRPEDFYKQLVVVETCISAPWRMVAKITIHELDSVAGDRRGDIITLTMKEMNNVELARTSSIQACQMLMLAADERGTIHCYGEDGEQNHCWVEPSYRHVSPMTCTIRDKYWGQQQTIKFRQLCRVMCKIHGWELVDETQNLLDRIVEAIEESPED
jgi:hypothetical protein